MGLFSEERQQEIHLFCEQGQNRSMAVFLTWFVMYEHQRMPLAHVHAFLKEIGFRPQAYNAAGTWTGEAAGWDGPVRAAVDQPLPGRHE